MSTEITVLIWTQPAAAWLLEGIALIACGIALGVHTWRGLADALASARRYDEQLAEDFIAPVRRAPGPDDTITDAELRRLIHAAAWEADIAAIREDEALIQEWLDAGCPPAAVPWSLARFET